MVESGQINFTEKLFSFGMHTPGWRDTQTCLSGLKICPLSDTWTNDLSLQWKLVLAMKMEKEKRRSIVKTGGYNTFLRWPKISWPADYTIRNIILSFWSDIYGKLSFLSRSWVMTVPLPTNRGLRKVKPHQRLKVKSNQRISDAYWSLYICRPM